jgi:hypothetical protein
MLTPALAIRSDLSDLRRTDTVLAQRFAEVRDLVFVLGAGAFLKPGPEPGPPPLSGPDPGHQRA